ncbi:MAG: methylmalonyl-CoA epimerase [Myxococcota bacterium]
MYVKIHHLGIAVSDLEGTTHTFESLLGLPLEHTEEVPSEKARVSFFPVGESSLELVQPTDPSSTLSKYLEKRGPGIHHVCLEVQDIRAMMETLKSRGVKLIHEQPTPGAHGAEVCFIHPKAAGGILIELRQGPQEERLNG